MTEESKDTFPSVQAFRKEYIWGFTQNKPMYHSEDSAGFHKLIALVAGPNPVITIGASFHPYQLVSKAGTDVWETVFNVIKDNDYCDFDDLIQNNSYFHMNPPGMQAFPVQVWADARLSYEVHPEFSKFVPFLIPYLTLENQSEPWWSLKIHEAMQSSGHAGDYLEAVNKAAGFLMPEPSFVVGFGVFEKENAAEVIDNYVSFLNKSIKKT